MSHSIEFKDMLYLFVYACRTKPVPTFVRYALKAFHPKVDTCFEARFFCVRL